VPALDLAGGRLYDDEVASYHPRVCRSCRARARDGYKISKKGLCLDCGNARLTANMEAMDAKQGPEWRRWRKRHAASMRRYLSSLGDTT